MRSTRSFVTVAATVAGFMAIALLGTSCSTQSVSSVTSAGGEPVDYIARDYVIDRIAQRGEIFDGVWPETSIDDLLPNREFAIDGAAPEPLADGIVVGTVTAVDQGRGYAVEGDDAPGGIEVAFDDPRSVWRVVVLTITTDTRLGDADARTIKVGVVIDGGMDAEKARKGYLSLGRVALVLDEPGFFEFDPSLYSVRQSGNLFGVVTKSGAVQFPGLGSGAASFVGSTDTVADLVAEASEVPVVIDVSTKAGQFARDDR